MEKPIKEKVKVSKDNPSLQRLESKCIDCGMCLQVCENVVGLNHKLESKKNPLCLHCGQCIMNCPVGALCTKYDYKKVLNLLKDTDKKVAISIAPAVRVSIQKELNLSLDVNVEKLLPSILKKLGFTYVFDVSFGADVTIMEEASELLERLKDKTNLPMYTSCCPSWVKYAEMFHPDILENLSSVKSPIEIQSSLIKSYFKEINDIKENILSVAVAPCTAKKYEAFNGKTDYIITSEELILMIKECNIDIKNLHPESFDSLLSTSSKCGLMFGTSGGVMEASLNYAYYLINKKNPPLNYFHLKIDKEITTTSFKLGKGIINVAVIYGLKNFEKFLPESKMYDFIEVMNCPKGCIGGGGQPLQIIKNNQDVISNRKNDLQNIDRKILYSYQNPEIKDLYNCYLGRPLSDKAIELLHRKYENKSYLLKK